MRVAISYIPGLSGFQKPDNQVEPPQEVADTKVPPKRPDHDVQVEQFLRKQYHSKAGDGMPNPDKK